MTAKNEPDDPFDLSAIASESESDLFPPDPWETRNRIHAEAQKAGDVNMVSKYAFPAVYLQGHPPAFRSLEYKGVKDTCQAIDNYGLQAPYTQQLLKVLHRTQTLNPHDCKTLADALLTPFQYLLWHGTWKKYLEELDVHYLQLPNGHMLRQVTMQMLLGEGDWTNPHQQVVLPQEVLQALSTASLQAFTTVRTAGNPSKAYTDIKQGTTEPYMQFTDRLQDSSSKQVHDNAAHELLLKQLALNNANDDINKY